MRIQMVGSTVTLALVLVAARAGVSGAQPADLAAAPSGARLGTAATAEAGAARASAARSARAVASFDAAAMRRRDNPLWQASRNSSADTTVVSGVAIARVEEGGTIIVLQDGTRWEVFLPDRTSTDTWQEGDFVSVRMRPIMEGEGSRYRYELVNGRARSEAAVRFSGVVTQ